MNATAAVYTLRNPNAVRTGEIHRVYFRIDAAEGQAVIVYDDCSSTKTEFVDVETARQEWARLRGIGCVKGESDRAARIVDWCVENMRKMRALMESQPRIKAGDRWSTSA